MASIFYRGKPPAGCWWVQYYHPRTGEITRFSLATGDRYAAEVIRRRVELEVDLRRPELQLQFVPAPIVENLGPAFPTVALNVSPAPQETSPEPAVESKPRATTADLLKLYWHVIQEENVAEHQSNKLSILRHFFGGALVAEVTGVACRSMPLAYFEGQFADEITAQNIRDFIASRNLEPKTKRHYRELFHNLFEVALADGLLAPINYHSPNPMSALPSYSARRRKPIIFLKPEDITRQFEVLRDCPPMLAAAQLMIHAGLRRAEALWLTKDCFHNLEYLSVRTQYDTESGDDAEQNGEPREAGSLKTEGSTRPVSILPPLRTFLEGYLPTLEGDWIVPNPWKPGRRWEKGNFSSALRKLNSKQDLVWNCLHYRHTFATARCGEGWNVWDLANEMGTSVAMIQKHYAAFLQPARLQRQKQDGSH